MNSSMNSFIAAKEAIMSDKKVLNAKEINEEILEKVDGGVAMNDLLMNRDRKSMNVETLPTGGRTFTIESAIATGEQIRPSASKMDTSDESAVAAKKRIPRIVFADKGTSV